MPLARAYDDVISFCAGGPTREQIAAFRLSDEAAERIRELLQKNSAGTLTADESAELDQCVQLDQLIILIRSRGRQQGHVEKTA
jgi:hypothetical protein